MYMVQMLTCRLFVHSFDRLMIRQKWHLSVVLSNSQLLKVHVILHSKLMFNFSQQLHM